MRVRLLGVAPDGGCRVSPAARPVNPDPRRLVSVALFLAFVGRANGDLLRPGVTRHPALRSPDFPPPGYPGGDGLAGFGLLGYPNYTTRHATVSPARTGTTGCVSNGYSVGTVHAVRSSVTLSALRGSR